MLTAESIVSIVSLLECLLSPPELTTLAKCWGSEITSRENSSWLEFSLVWFRDFFFRTGTDVDLFLIFPLCLFGDLGSASDCPLVLSSEDDLFFNVSNLSDLRDINSHVHVH